MTRTKDSRSNDLEDMEAENEASVLAIFILQNKYIS